MPIRYVTQLSTLSRYTPIDEETGETLPEEVWSDRLWATEFADVVQLSGLTISWGNCRIYHRGRTFQIPAWSVTLQADPVYRKQVTIWLDTSSPDNLTVDEVLLDGVEVPPPPPDVGGDHVRLAWGTIEPGATDMVLYVLRHVEER